MAAEMEIDYLEHMFKEIVKYVSEDVNWIEACAIYAEKHNIDYETLGAVIKRNPKILSEVTTAARNSKVVNLDYATLPI